jgi:predicted ATPase
MNVSITKIKIGNLSVDYVLLVAEALGMDDDDGKVKILAETIHRKTEGNPFFILMFRLALMLISMVTSRCFYRTNI